MNDPRTAVGEAGPVLVVLVTLAVLWIVAARRRPADTPARCGMPQLVGLLAAVAVLVLLILAAAS